MSSPFNFSTVDRAQLAPPSLVVSGFMANAKMTKTLSSGNSQTCGRVSFVVEC